MPLFCFSIHELIDFLAIMNNAAFIPAQIFVWTYVFMSLGYISRSGIGGLNGNSNFLRNFQIVFQGSYIILFSHQKCMRVPISPHRCCYLLSVLLILAILVMWNVILVVFTFISLMASDIERLSCACWLVAYLLWRNVRSVFRPFSKLVVCLSVVDFL